MDPLKPKTFDDTSAMKEFIFGLRLSFTGHMKATRNNEFDILENMDNMFNGCENITSLDLSEFDTSSVTDMSRMFTYCTNLTSINLSKFDTSSVTDMCYMFSDCTNLTSLDLSSFDTINVSDEGFMFHNCTSVNTAYARTQTDVNNFNNSTFKPDNINFIVKS